MVSTAISNASHTSPSPMVNSRILGPLNPGSSTFPSVTDSTSILAWAASRATWWPVPFFKTFILRTLSPERTTSLHSKMRDRYSSSVAPAYLRSSLGTQSLLSNTVARSPSAMRVTARDTTLDTGPKTGLPTVNSSFPRSSRVLPPLDVSFQDRTTSCPSTALSSPRPSVTMVFTARWSPKRSSLVTQPSNSTLKQRVAFFGTPGAP
mmetsp:Transcript_27037/g.71114  ORF Transcript_27037/g.71114 Transcript_27037/m.71114 type:complete len:207 (-) Transcript_27037:473-1093(-)